MIKDLIALAMAVIFFTIALAHFYWAFFAKIISPKVIPHIDGKPAFIPSKAITVFVGIVFIILTAFVTIMSLRWQSSLLNPFYQIAGSLLTLIFLLRAIGDFKLVGFFKKIKNSEFAFFDTRYWSPLCAILAIFIAYLTWL